MYICASSVGDAEARGFLAKRVRLERDIVFKSEWGATEEEAQPWPLAYTSIYMQVHPHTHVYIHVNTYTTHYTHTSDKQALSP